VRVAAVDIGSNTLLLLVAQVDATGALQAVRDECRFGRLGQRLDATGQLADEAIERSLGIVREYRALIDELKVERVVVAGTEALRKASNADRFVAPAEQILRAPIEVVTGEREAQLVHLAVARSFPDLAGKSFVIADVGGASTEIIVTRDGELALLTSLPIGAVRMSERHLHGDPPTADQARALLADIDRALTAVDLPRDVPVVGTAGTASSLATVEQKLRVYHPDRVNGFRLSPAQVDRLLARFFELTVAEKRRLPGLEPERADVIAGGAAIYARLCHRVHAPEMIVSDRGLRWGLAHQAAESR
jgi:exopolyphosphatase/guanosine-5'-triphosphate,3'-diphosphate pyrophosphatase